MVVFIVKNQILSDNSPDSRQKIIGRKCLGENRTVLPSFPIFSSLPFPTFNLDLISYSRIDEKKCIKIPSTLTPALAEEMGIHYGDGFLSGKRYEYRLKGNKDERSYYDLYLSQLYKNLYNVDLNLRDYETTYGFELCSKAIWQFKKDILNLPAGRKDNMVFPSIFGNNIKLLIPFIRGLFDTDGSVSFVNKYSLGNYYPVICISLKSKVFIKELFNKLSLLGFAPNFYPNEDSLAIQLNGYERFFRFYRLIGWKNPKHLNKIERWKQKYPKLWRS